MNFKAVEEQERPDASQEVSDWVPMRTRSEAPRLLCQGTPRRRRVDENQAESLGSEPSAVPTQGTFLVVQERRLYRAKSKEEKKNLGPWPGSSVVWSILLIRQGCRFDPLSGHIQESTNE